MKRLWDKGNKLDQEIHDFSVGNDPELDMHIIEHDIIASCAHAKMLETINIINKDELSKILASLKKLNAEITNNKFEIAHELEDGHTAIESYLTKEIGDAGLKIHTGRSRNDQVLVAMRLYLRAEFIEIFKLQSTLANSFLKRAKEFKNTAFPGYTHMQPAMPSSVSMWTHCFAESIVESLYDGLSYIERINLNPLGVASGFGVPLNLDRDLTTKLLDFSKTQKNPINVQNSRGKAELKFLRFCTDLSSIIEKLAFDMQIYSTKEFGFIELPVEATTGSSIMPQKRNPDVLELLRGNTAKIRACEDEMRWVIAKLPSNYHRDFQYTKEPVIRASSVIKQQLKITDNIIKNFKINSEMIKLAMCDELFATYEVYRKVSNGMPFRDAYREVGDNIKKANLDVKELEKDFSSIEDSVFKEVLESSKDLEKIDSDIKKWGVRLEKVRGNLLL